MVQQVRQGEDASGILVRRVPMIIYDLNAARTVAFAVQTLDGGCIRAYHLSHLEGLERCERMHGLVVQKSRNMASGDVDVRILSVSRRPYTQEELEAHYAFEDFEIRQLSEVANGFSSSRRFNAFGYTSDGDLQVILREAFFDESTEFRRIGVGTLVRCLPVEATHIQRKKGYHCDKGAFARVLVY